MSQQLLHRADVHAALDQMRREAVVERVAVQGMTQVGGPPGRGHAPLQRSGINVVPSLTPHPRTVR
jgi:hypothetical protein